MTLALQVIQDSGRTEDELDEEVRERVAEAEQQVRLLLISIILHTVFNCFFS